MNPLGSCGSHWSSIGTPVLQTRSPLSWWRPQQGRARRRPWPPCDVWSSRVSGRRIDDRTDEVDGIGGQTGQPRMLANDVGIVGEVDAEDLVVGDVALLPLDAG